MATAQDVYDRFEAFIKQTAPTADVAPGSALADLALRLPANLLSNEETVINSVSLSRGLDDAVASPDTITDNLTRLALNFGVQRKTGSTQTGVLKVTVAGSYTPTIRQGTIFSTASQGLEFVVTTSATPAASPVGSQIQLYTQGSQTFFYVPVRASAVGAEYAIPAGTSLSPKDTTISGLVSVSQFGQFTGAEDPETDGELLSRIKKTLTVRNFTSPQAIRQAFQDQLPAVLDVSTVGVKSQSLLRSRANPFGITLPGFVDVYVRTSKFSAIAELTMVGTKVSSDGTNQVFNVHVPQTAIPGFSQVYAVNDASREMPQAGTLPFAVSYGQSFPEGQQHLVSNTSDSKLSAFQTADIQVTTHQASAGTFVIQFIAQPGISDLQSLVDDPSSRCLASDIMVKSVRPCFVSIGIKLAKLSQTDTWGSVGLDSLVADVADYVNSLPLGSPIEASRIVNLCHKYAIRRVDLPVKMTGFITDNNGDTVTISDEDLLEIPLNPSIGVTPETCAFFLDVFPVVPNTGINISLS